MTYKDLPASIRNQIEELEISIDAKEQVMDTLGTLFPKQQEVLFLLVEKYAEQSHKELLTEQELIKAGYNLNELRRAYWEKS